jgi:hypothetical protein
MLHRSRFRTAIEGMPGVRRGDTELFKLRDESLEELVVGATELVRSRASDCEAGVPPIQPRRTRRPFLTTWFASEPNVRAIVSHP